VSFFLGCYSVKAISERNVALKFACFLLASRKLCQFQGKHEFIFVKGHLQCLKFKILYRNVNDQMEPELECISLVRASNVDENFSTFVTDIHNRENVSNVSACTAPLACISIPIVPSGTVTSSIDLLDTLKTVWSYSSLKPLQQKAIDSILCCEVF